MSDDPPPPIWPPLALGLLFLGLIPVVIQTNGLPGGWGFVEVIVLPALVGSGFTLLGLWRLLTRRRGR